MTFDPLSTSVSKINIPRVILLNHSFEPDLFFDGDRFMDHLNKTYDTFDVLTYSTSKAFVPPLRRVNRLIYGVRGCKLSCKEKKYIMNNHTKVFICYSPPILNGVQIVDVFVGSQNLTHGTNLNIMYKVQPIHVKPLTDFFEQLWNSL